MSLEQVKQDFKVSVNLDQANTLVIQSVEDLQIASNLIKALKNEYKAIEDKRKELTSPLDLSKKRIMDEFKPLLDARQYLIDKLSKEAISYNSELEKQRQEAIRKAEQERQKEIERLRKQQELAKKDETKEKIEDKILEVELAPAPVMAETKFAGTSYRTIYSAEIIDASKVPAEFLIPDIKAIDAFVKATKGQKQISGVKIIENKTLVSR